MTNRGNRLDRHQLHRIIKAAANRAGINPHVSTHWLRHAHACHSLENGCDIDVSREKSWTLKPDRYLEVPARTTGGGVSVNLLASDSPRPSHFAHYVRSLNPVAEGCYKKTIPRIYGTVHIQFTHEIIPENQVEISIYT